MRSAVQSPDWYLPTFSFTPEQNMKYPIWRQVGYFCFWTGHFSLNPHLIIMFHSILTTLGIPLDAISLLNHIITYLEQILHWVSSTLNIQM